uniref:Uncharacterized protein n=1 Tax=Ursus maritimus TaxID=29073 RepID=A0A452UMS9_URSMA
MCPPYYLSPVYPIPPPPSPLKPSVCFPESTVSHGEWIGVRKKCFYFSRDTKNWTASKRFCSSQGSELAHIDTQEDMVRKGESS